MRSKTRALLHGPSPGGAGSGGIATALVCLGFVLSAGSLDAQLSTELVLGPGHSTSIHIMRDASQRTGPCPLSALRYDLDASADPEWTRSNRALWDEAALLAVLVSAVRRAYDEAPGPPPVVCAGLAAKPPHRVLELLRGIGAAAMSPRFIVFFLSPALNDKWLEELPATLAHEYHHAVYWRNPRVGLDILIREGLAHHFARTLYPAVLHPSMLALDRSELASSWARIRENLDIDPTEFTYQYMFGGPYYGNRVPRWAGYTIGYCLVQAYAERHPDLSTAGLARVARPAFVSSGVRCPAR